MRLTLQLAALALAFISLAVWFFGGPNFGRTSSNSLHAFPEQIVAVDSTSAGRFNLGLDFLAVCWIAAGVLFGIAQFIPRQHLSPHNNASSDSSLS